MYGEKIVEKSPAYRRLNMTSKFINKYLMCGLWKWIEQRVTRENQLLKRATFAYQAYNDFVVRLIPLNDIGETDKNHEYSKY